MRGDDRLVVQFQFVCGKRARQFALDEFLIRGHGVDRGLEGDNNAGPLLAGRAQR